MDALNKGKQKSNLREEPVKRAKVWTAPRPKATSTRPLGVSVPRPSIGSSGPAVTSGTLHRAFSGPTTSKVKIEKESASQSTAHRLFWTPKVLVTAVIVLAFSLVSLGLIGFWTVNTWDGDYLKITQPAPKASAASAASATPWDLSMKIWDPNKGHARNQSVLEGVVLDDREPFGLIAGQIYKIGDFWEGKEIVSINRRGIYLRDSDGKASFLKTKR